VVSAVKPRGVLILQVEVGPSGKVTYGVIGSNGQARTISRTGVGHVCQTRI
jgi:hypothetical protein